MDFRIIFSKFVQPTRCILSLGVNQNLTNNFIMRRFGLSVSLFFLAFSALAQMTVSSGVLTPQQYVNNLVGPGISVSNVTYTGTNAQIGTFGGTSNIGFTGGVVLSSGAASELVGPANLATGGQVNVSGITNTMNPTIGNLLTIANANLQSLGLGSATLATDGAILEFDFVPISNVVSFNFVFSSDEYLTYVNTQFNDIFGFFVAGPGITGPYSAPGGFPNGSVNLALVPGTNSPITISTIHPNLNSQYYIDNAGGQTHTMNGFTIPIPITFDVICGETYHFKFAVADVADNYLSTAVFLENDSFTSPPVDLTLETASGSDTIPEACVDANVLFIRSACESLDTLIVDYTVTGTAQNGVDFNIAASPITMLPGQDTAAINIVPIVDVIPEGTETIIVQVSYIDGQGNPQVISGTLFLSDIQPVVLDETDLTLKCFNDSIVIGIDASGGSESFTYDWESSASDSTTDVVSILQNGSYDYIVTVTDECLGDFVDTVTVIMDQTLAIDTIWVGPATCEPVGYVSAFISGQTVTPQQNVQYTWTGPGPNSPNFINASVWTDLSSGWYYINVQDAVCEVNDSAFVDIENAPVATINSLITNGCSPLSVNFINTSQNATSYEWDFGDGSVINTTDQSGQMHEFTASSVVTLTAYQSPDCFDQMSIPVTVSICGCTDPTATNFNPQATFDDGSCLYPTPSVYVPNIFTPNADGSNDGFFLTTKNATNVELTILNRWGLVMFKESGLNPEWNGLFNDSEAQDGTYFYTYIVTGVQGDTLEGHGFLQLVRNP
jgi:gliding motility-associated-like protein